MFTNINTNRRRCSSNVILGYMSDVASALLGYTPYKYTEKPKVSSIKRKTANFEFVVDNTLADVATLNWKDVPIPGDDILHNLKHIKFSRRNGDSIWMMFDCLNRCGRVGCTVAASSTQVCGALSRKTNNPNDMGVQEEMQVCCLRGVLRAMQEEFGERDVNGQLNLSEYRPLPYRRGVMHKCVHKSMSGVKFDLSREDLNDAEPKLGQWYRLCPSWIVDNWTEGRNISSKLGKSKLGTNCVQNYFIWGLDFSDQYGLGKKYPPYTKASYIKHQQKFNREKTFKDFYVMLKDMLECKFDEIITVLPGSGVFMPNNLECREETSKDIVECFLKAICQVYVDNQQYFNLKWFNCIHLPQDLFNTPFEKYLINYLTQYQAGIVTPGIVKPGIVTAGTSAEPGTLAQQPSTIIVKPEQPGTIIVTPGIVTAGTSGTLAQQPGTIIIVPEKKINQEQQKIKQEQKKTIKHEPQKKKQSKKKNITRATIKNKSRATKKNRTRATKRNWTRATK